LFPFSQALIGFPNVHKTLFYEAGAKDDDAYFSMRLYCLGNADLVGIELHLESNVVTEFSPEEKSKL
jgi:hypothetical protein